MKVKLIIALTTSILWSCENQQPHETQNEAIATPIDSAYYLNRGKEIVQQSFKTLKSHLQTAMKNGGPNHAIKFCNIKAMPLTDSLSQAFHVKIQRISHRPRNEQNKATSDDLTLINQYINTHNNQPSRQIADETVIFYAPIYTKPVCLTCHGTPNQTISKETYQLITQLYPNDKAINFKEGELRGLWKISFAENE